MTEINLFAWETGQHTSGTIKYEINLILKDKSYFILFTSSQETDIEHLVTESDRNSSLGLRARIFPI